MTAESEINSVLLIPRNYQRFLSKDRAVCLVSCARQSKLGRLTRSRKILYVKAQIICCFTDLPLFSQEVLGSASVTQKSVSLVE